MLIPRYWAEHRDLRKFPDGKQATIRRFGWSMDSQEDARRHAEQRVAEAWESRTVPSLWKRLRYREPRAAYEFEGLPIREEIVEEYPEVGAVVTRNRYGARCLNVPDILFADIDTGSVGDRREAFGCSLVALVVLVAIPALLNWYFQGPWLVLTLIALFAIGCGIACLSSWRGYRLAKRPQDALIRVRGWCALNPAWRLHIYRTPAGFRLLATHAPIDPQGEEARKFAAAIGGDPLYQSMCVKQACFRARVSGKPWRMGMESRYGRRLWPWETPEETASRAAWVAEYEIVSLRYAACEFLETIGDGPDHPRAKAVREIHDRLCQMGRGFPSA
jgi:hypothetical protein